MGFTIIELLVVVGIIGVLVAILLPALDNARASGRNSKCLANQRSLAQGFAFYAYQNKGQCLPGRPAKIGASTDPRNVYFVGNGRQYRPRWYIRLGEFTSIHAYDTPSTDPADDNTKTVDNEAVICPEVPHHINNRNAAYGYNFQFLGNTRAHPSRPFMNYPVEYEFLLAHKTVMSADNLGTAAGKPEAQRTEYRIDGASDLLAVGNHAWSLDPPRLAADSDYCDNKNRSPEHRSAPDRRHRNLSNFSFIDGHAKSLDPATLGYVQNADGSYVANGGGAHNEFFSGTGRDDAPPSIN